MSRIATGIPVIDAADLFSTDPTSQPFQKVVQSIRSACKEWGFFQLKGHGVPEELMRRADAEMRAFFALPLPQKQSCRRSEDNSRGFFNDEYTKQLLDRKEGFDFGHKPAPELPDDAAPNRTLDGHNRWPDAQPTFREVMTAFYAAMEGLAYRLLDALSVGLGLPLDALRPLFAEHTSFQRLNYYPLQGDGQSGLGISPHKDAGFLTLLVQDDVPGLEVEKDGEWHLVLPEPGAITINLGDMAQVLTNDQYRASFHRVRASTGRERYSAPFFFNPSYSAVIKPVEALVDPSEGPHYRPISYREFRQLRYAGDYASRGEEVQIEHYRLVKAEA